MDGRQTGHVRYTDLMRMRLLGGLEAEGVNLGRLGSRKARRVLARLAVARGAPVAVDSLADIVWGDDQPSHPADQLSVLISRLRSAVGAENVVRTDAGYCLGIDWLDLVAVEELVGEARRRMDAGAVGPAQMAARGALELLRGPLLPEEPDDTSWLEADRASLARSASTARLVAAEATLTAGDPWAAAAYADSALTAEPYDEAALRVLMSAHAAAGRPALAFRAYAEMAERLRTDLGIDPAAATRALHVALLREGDRPNAPASSVGSDLPPSPRGRRSGPRRPPTEEASPETASRSPSGGLLVGHTRGPVARTNADAEPWSELPGRQTELAQLAAALAGTVHGGAHLVVVEGEAGIGKTRLLKEFALSLEGPAVGGAIVLTCRGDEFAGALPLQPLLDALAGYVQRLPDPAAVDALLSGDAAPVRGLLGLPGDRGPALSHLAVAGSDSYRANSARRAVGASSRPAATTRGRTRDVSTLAGAVASTATAAADDPPSDEDTEMMRLFAAYDAVIARMTTKATVVLCIDDVQWSDSASRAWLRHGVQRLSGLPLLILAAQRTGEGKSLRGDTVLRLTMLDRAAAAAALGVAELSDLDDQLYRRSGGNPMFLRELARADGTELPLSIRDSVRQRCERAGPAVGATLQAAAVLGPDIERRAARRRPRPARVGPAGPSRGWHPATDSRRELLWRPVCPSACP